MCFNLVLCYYYLYVIVPINHISKLQWVQPTEPRVSPRLVSEVIVYRLLTPLNLLHWHTRPSSLTNQGRCSATSAAAQYTLALLWLKTAKYN